MLIGAMEPSRRNRTFSMRGLTASYFIAVKYLNFFISFPVIYIPIYSIEPLNFAISPPYQPHSDCINISIQRCPGTSKILQWQDRRNWIIDIPELQISCCPWKIIQINESESISKFKYGSGFWIEQNSDADLIFRFDLIFHSWPFSSCLHVMLLSRLFCHVIILPKTAYLTFRTLSKGNIFLRAHIGPCRGGLVALGFDRLER